jgi:hypothetical protein
MSSMTANPEGRRAAGYGTPLIVAGSDGPPTGVVMVAVDNDDNAGAVLRYGAAEAHRRGVPLRAVHVWTGPATAQNDLACAADRLLTAVLHDNLPEEADGIERQILHDRDPVGALIAISAHASLLVVAARSGSGTNDDPYGETARALIGRTVSPLAVLPQIDGRRPDASPHAW